MQKSHPKINSYLIQYFFIWPTAVWQTFAARMKQKIFTVDERFYIAGTG
jgi:hypothetical protein